ncbi:MAG: glycosyltransferase [Gammaproteobacteria bacterium]|nr:glycosyltransferase [Gammaproteobacteria bacterium]MBU1977576.1 glycosyltransferase [Gammaproteobacteria bacterium]
MEQLWPEIRSAARLLRERYSAVQIPLSWMAVSEKLRELRAKNQKALNFSEFTKLCQTHNGLGHPSVVAGYLHRAGQAFWQEGAFGNDLLLDQEWALAGIYALLERNEILPMIRENHGSFSLRQLNATVWQKYSPKEQKLFLGMMQQCGACFPLGNDQYIASELLPSERQRRTDIDAIWRDAEASALVELRYEFLHDGIIKAILCHIGEKAGNAGVYWRQGVCYFDREARGAVRISGNWEEGQVNTRHGLIIVEVEGPHAERLAMHLVDSIESLRIGASPKVKWCTGQPAKDEGTHRQSIDEKKAQAPFAGVAPDPDLGGRAGPTQGPVIERATSIERQCILLIATEWRSHHGGLSTFNRELCIALAQLDNDVYCAVSEASEDDITNAKEKNVTLVKARPVTGGDPVSGLLCKLPLPADFQPDVIIGHGRITGQAAKIQQEDNYRKAKRIHFVHMAPGEIEWFKGKKNAAQLAALREESELDLAQDADLVAAVGPRLLRETATLIDRLPPKKRPKTVQFNPGFRRTESRPAPPHSLHCLMLGRAEDEELKGVDIAARAIQQIDRAKLQHKPELIIRGAPVNTGTALQKKLASDYPGLGVRVKEYSAKAGQIEADFRSAALALMPSRREGFGLVALEALSVGTPILVSENSGFAELLKTLTKPHEWGNYIVETPDDLEKAGQEWQDKIFNELRDVDASIRRANKLADILAEILSWRTSCKSLMAELNII